MVLENKQGLHMKKKKKDLQKRIIDFLPMAKDMTRNDIAKALNISVVTLRAHLEEIQGEYFLDLETGTVKHINDNTKG